MTYLIRRMLQDGTWSPWRCCSHQEYAMAQREGGTQTKVLP